MLPKTILVTDDHPHILKLVEYSLEEINCWIETARSGEEAVSKAARMQIDHHVHARPADTTRCPGARL